jgi:hypothetical protein
MSVTREVKVIEQERQQGRKCETESEECQRVELTDKRATAPAELSKTYNEKKNRGRRNIFVCSPKCPNQLWGPISLLHNEYLFFFPGETRPWPDIDHTTLTNALPPYMPSCAQTQSYVLVYERPRQLTKGDYGYNEHNRCSVTSDHEPLMETSFEN